VKAKLSHINSRVNRWKLRFHLLTVQLMVTPNAMTKYKLMLVYVLLYNHKIITFNKMCYNVYHNYCHMKKIEI
jgi:hypothetical protein